MGLRDYLERRRERESAISPAEIEQHLAEGGPRAPADPGPRNSAASAPTAEAGTAGPEQEPLNLPGAGPAELARMLAAAAAGGIPQVSGESHRLERPDQLGDELVALLASAGVAVAGEGAPSEEGERLEVGPEEAARLLEGVRARLAELEGDAEADATDGDPA